MEKETLIWYIFGLSNILFDLIIVSINKNASLIVQIYFLSNYVYFLLYIFLQENS